MHWWMVTDVISGSQLLGAFDRHPPMDALASTGLSELDDLTGGMHAGHVWVITGDVGEGRTMLLTQLAVRLAAEGHVTQLVCPSEVAAWTTRRLLSALGRTPVHVRGGSQLQPSRLDAAREALAGLPLAVAAKGAAPFTPETDPYAEPPAAAVLVDDADLVGGVTPERVTRYAEEGRFVAVVLPREQVLRGRGDRAPLRPRWSRLSDVVIEVRTRPIGGTGTAGAHRPAELRPGEADLIVHRHRWGLSRTFAVVAHLHLARFQDLTAESR